MGCESFLMIKQTHKVPTDVFIEEWKKDQSVTQIARKLGMTVRAVQLRRQAIREKLGINLQNNHPLSPYRGDDPIRDINPIKRSKARVDVEVSDGVVLVGSDAHYIPGQITTAHRAFVKFCKELKPRVVVLNGDIFDGGSISRFPRIGWDNKPMVKDELAACKERVAEIEIAAGQARKIWTLGNHDARFETKLAAHAPEYEGIEGFHLKDHFSNWIPCWSILVNNDELFIKHRFKGGIHAPYNNTLHSGRNICTGHLHAQQITRFSDMDGARYGVDAGMLGEPYTEQFDDYTETNPLNWQSGFCVFTFIKGKLMPPELVQVLDEGRVWFRGEVHAA